MDCPIVHSELHNRTMFRLSRVDGTNSHQRTRSYEFTQILFGFVNLYEKIGLSLTTHSCFGMTTIKVLKTCFFDIQLNCASGNCVRAVRVFEGFQCSIQLFFFLTLRNTGFPASWKIMKTWKMKITFSRPGKIMEFEKKPQKPGKIMEFEKINLKKSWNFVSDLKHCKTNFLLRCAHTSSIQNTCSCTFHCWTLVFPSFHFYHNSCISCD